MAVQNSINTNLGALVALRNMNKTNSELAKTQDRISTGLKVIGAKDDASSFAIAQGIRAEIKAIQAVQQGLANGRGVAGVALAGVTEISNMLIDLKKKVVEGMNAGNTTAQQAILDSDFTELLNQVKNFVLNAEFNGKNIISGGGSVNVIADSKGGTLQITGQNMSAVFNALNAESLATTATATSALAVVNTQLDTVAQSLAGLGADARALDFQDEFLNAISDSLTEGLGAIVDADLAKESAMLQALQVKQQLSVQALSIANSAPQVLLGLFRG